MARSTADRHHRSRTPRPPSTATAFNSKPRSVARRLASQWHLRILKSASHAPRIDRAAADSGAGRDQDEIALPSGSSALIK